jgi:hypothetical protein
VRHGWRATNTSAIIKFPEVAAPLFAKRFLDHRDAGNDNMFVALSSIGFHPRRF